jgi:pimeloyl-ACP methyl ester carboxylesterase
MIAMHELKAPSLMALAGESLTPFELTRLVAASPSLARQTRGRGEPVLVLPGLGASNSSTALLRNYLTWLGYNVQGWTLGRNRGNVAEMLPWVVDQLRVLHARTGSKVHAIGWSLGGILAREAAREYPETVHQVVTLGSPVVGGPKYTSMGALYTRNGGNLDDIEAAIAARESTPISVPVTSIYSKRDGIVGWQASIDRHSSDIEHIEVRATHLGLGISPEVFKILARKLANA